MPPEAIVTIVLLGLTVLLLVTEWVPPGVTGLCAIAALALTGVLPPERAFAGLTNPAFLTVASMYVLSAAVERTGAAGAMANRLTGSGSGSPAVAYHLLLVATMLLSGFVNNTPLILIFLPLVLGLARRMGEAPSKLLIPLSYVSILGGSATLIGTSTNLIVAARACGRRPAATSRWACSTSRASASCWRCSAGCWCSSCAAASCRTARSSGS